MSLSWSKADSVIYLPPPTFQSFLLNRLLIFLLGCLHVLNSMFIINSWHFIHLIWELEEVAEVQLSANIFHSRQKPGLVSDLFNLYIGELDLIFKEPGEEPRYWFVFMVGEVPGENIIQHLVSEKLFEGFVNCWSHLTTLIVLVGWDCYGAIIWWLFSHLYSNFMLSKPFAWVKHALGWRK